MSPVSGDGPALATMLNTSSGESATDNGTALVVSPSALAAARVMESTRQSNPGETGTVSGTFQMSNGTYARTVHEVSSVGTSAAPIVIARAPEQAVDGRAKVLQLNGAPGWIKAEMIRPYHGVSYRFAACTPSPLSNGRIGTGCPS